MDAWLKEIENAKNLSCVVCTMIPGYSTWAILTALIELYHILSVRRIALRRNWFIDLLELSAPEKKGGGRHLVVNEGCFYGHQKRVFDKHKFTKNFS
jgi:hypothetical protein